MHGQEGDQAKQRLRVDMQMPERWTCGLNLSLHPVLPRSQFDAEAAERGGLPGMLVVLSDRPWSGEESYHPA
jgi:hypothetical protein